MVQGWNERDGEKKTNIESLIKNVDDVSLSNDGSVSLGEVL